MPTLPAPDVCLLLEGTYPYVSGGVSTWVHETIKALPELSFSILYIGSEKPAGATYGYTIPVNVLEIREIYLHGPAKPTSKSKSRRNPSEVHGAAAALLKVAVADPGVPDLLATLAEEVAKLAPDMSFDDFWRHAGTWHLLQQVYLSHAADSSFLDFFWSLRSLAAPVWQLMAAVPDLPSAKVYHSLCTGYAGLVAGLAARHHGGSAFLLSEHGIYVRERIADLLKARWIHDPPQLRPALLQHPALLRRIWIGFFEMLGRFAYHHAGRITTLFGSNAGFQTSLGAPPGKLEIIPNGVHAPEFTGVVKQRAGLMADNPQRQTIGFFGRVVSIKDVKTLIRAARIVIDFCPRANFLITGPLDEEPAYAEACQALSHQLGLEAQLSFTGSRTRGEFLPAIDIMVLSSISEGLPFVILEAFAAGIPCVSTAVGSCRELIEGRPDESPPCGLAGLVVPVGNAELLARAMVRLLTFPEHAAQMGESGRTRAMRHYSQEKVVQRYRSLYQNPIITAPES